MAKIYIWIKNTLNSKNKLHSKGCDLFIGLSVIDSLVIDSKGQNNCVVVGDSVKIKDCKIYIRGDNNKIVIGNKSTLRQVDFYIEDSQNEILIGSSTHFCGKTHLAAIEGTKIKFGDRCLLSSNLHFATGDSHSILDLSGERINPSKDIVIEDHVWIGTKVTCLKGV